MIGYVCKYTPIAIIESFGEKTCRLEPTTSNFDQAHTYTHPNICSYAKAVLEQCLNENFNQLILTTCCDSIKRIADLLAAQNNLKFLYLLDLPRKRNAAGEQKFTQELIKLIQAYEKFTQTKFSPANMLKILTTKENKPISTAGDKLKIGVTGARCPQSIIELIEEFDGKIIHNLTCTGELNLPNLNPKAEKNLISWYARSLLNTYPCMRMEDIDDRYQTIVESSKQLDGIIHHSVKFCDFYSFDYAYLKQKLDIPLLKIETDYTPQSEGQIRTRIEAFMESLGGKPSKTIKKQSNKIVAGIDSGSLSTNVVILDGNKNILSYSIVRTGAKSLDSAYRAFQEALEKANLTEKQISYVVSTGYGRISIPFSRKNVTEITCHGKGAFHLNNKIRTIIDIGGQDSKVIRLDENGEVIDFAMNDKCSAGTGRFLEVMAKTLEIPLEEMGPESLNSREEITITSMCTVFAESEVVSLIAQNKNKADLINGINNSIASRTIALLERVGGKGAYMMTGGVAKNIGVLKALENKIGEKIYVPEEPQIVGALGAALIALESLSEESKINQ